MKKPRVVANWKNFPDSIQGAEALATNLRRKSTIFKKISLYIAPPLPYLGLVSDKTSSFAKLAVQDLSLVQRGAHTGQVSSDILKSLGVRLAILGHSEKRALGEGDREVNEKVRLALSLGMEVIVCVGEKLRDPDGEHLELIGRQIKASLEGVKKADTRSVAISYEPVWAIGKSARDAIEPRDLAEMVIFIRKVLSDLFGRSEAEKIAILYGGSVESRNARELLHTGVAGFLVGHASLDADEFSNLVKSLLI